MVMNRIWLEMANGNGSGITGKLMHLIQYIREDMLQPIRYLMVGVGIGLAFIIVLELCVHLAGKGDWLRKNWRKWFWVLIIIYLTVLLNVAFFSREPGTRNQVSLTLFETWGNTMQCHAYFVENIIMFLPFGILFPMGFKKFQSGCFCVDMAFLFSLCLEIIQYETQRGYAQIDDVVTNTAGALAGWLFWRICKFVKDLIVS